MLCHQSHPNNVLDRQIGYGEMFENIDEEMFGGNDARVRAEAFGDISGGEERHTDDWDVAEEELEACNRVLIVRECIDKIIVG